MRHFVVSQPNYPESHAFSQSRSPSRATPSVIGSPQGGSTLITRVFSWSSLGMSDRPNSAEPIAWWSRDIRGVPGTWQKAAFAMRDFLPRKYGHVFLIFSISCLGIYASLWTGGKTESILDQDNLQDFLSLSLHSLWSRRRPYQSGLKINENIRQDDYIVSCATFTRCI
jgi:hypothetical protein